MEYCGTIILLQKQVTYGRFFRFLLCSFFQKRASRDGLLLLMPMINKNPRKQLQKERKKRSIWSFLATQRSSFPKYLCQPQVWLPGKATLPVIFQGFISS